MYGSQQSIFAPLKSKDGNSTLTQPEDIQARWCEYYTEFFNRYPIVEESVLDLFEQREPIVSLHEVPSWNEINISVKQINTNKVSGMDGIPAEILKFGGDKMIDILELIIRDVKEIEARQDWRDAILCHCIRGGPSRTVGILLSNVAKVFSRIILNRLIGAIVNNALPESQCGFRANRVTVDMIFCVRQLQEKCREQNLPLYHCFLDFLKAFHTVNRSTLWKILLKLGCPEKFVYLIRSLHDRIKDRVGFSGALSDKISVDNGVKNFCTYAVYHLLHNSFSCGFL